MGRHPEPVPEKLAASYCDWLSEGRPATQWHRMKGHPQRQTLDDWMAKDPDFASRVARAREIGADAIAEEALSIADDSSNDTIETEEGGARMDSEWVARSRLRVETRLKLLACWNPKKYGQKQQLEHSGGVQVQVVTGVPE